jgi:hypothetical protein
MTFPMIVGLAFSLWSSHRDAAIGARQESTTGEITAHERNNHDSYRYEFTAQGKKFSGLSSSPRAKETMGEPAQIYFDPQNPTTNSLEDFLERSRRDKSLDSIFIFVICAIPAIIFCSKIDWSKRI